MRGAAKGTAYYGSKFALRGMTECWRAELRQYNIRVMLVNPSEVLTELLRNGRTPAAKENPTKLHGDDIAHPSNRRSKWTTAGSCRSFRCSATDPKD